MLKKLLNHKDVSVYECAKKTNIPYSTLSDLVNNRTRLKNASSEITFKLSKFFNISMELLTKADLERDNIEVFENFKSNLQHQLRHMGDDDFLDYTKTKQNIAMYWLADKEYESFYLLGLCDYLCHLHNKSIFEDYGEIRKYKAKELIYPQDALILDKLGLRKKEEWLKNAIPEFLEYNIVEGDIRNVR